MPKGRVQKYKLVDSRDDVLIQLADMVVGAAARKLTRHKPEYSSQWMRMIQPKCVSEEFLNEKDTV